MNKFIIGKGCSRNQFECHTDGECIAIYNACDGIEQCQDGSDEAPELHCPGNQGWLLFLSLKYYVMQKNPSKIFSIHFFFLYIIKRNGYVYWLPLFQHFDAPAEIPV